MENGLVDGHSSLWQKVVSLLEENMKLSGLDKPFLKRGKMWSWLVILPFSVIGAYSGPVNVDLGKADPFAVLGGSTLTNTGPTTIHGDLGLYPGTSFTNTGGLTLTGTQHLTDAVAQQAQNDLTTAYLFAAGEACQNNLTGQDLGGLTLTSGVYCFNSSAQLTGALTLNAQGDPNSVFVFQIGSTLTTASNSSVVFTNGGQGDSVFWQVGSSATLGTTTAFAGNILALTSITLTTGATIRCGRALARNGAVTMDTNVISIDTEGCESSPNGGGSPPAAVPEPGSFEALALGLAACLFWRRKLRLR